MPLHLEDCLPKLGATACLHRFSCGIVLKGEKGASERLPLPVTQSTVRVLMLWIPTMAILAGCPSGAGDADPHADAPSRVEPVDRAATDPLEALSNINDLPGDLAQQLAVEQLLMNGPPLSLAQQSCEVLERQPTRARCESLASRPHLLRTGSSTTVAGPARTAETALEEFQCMEAAEGEPHTPMKYALERVRFGSMSPESDPSTICDCLADPDQRAECRFMAAELLIRRDGADALRPALALCDLDRDLGRDCVSHIAESAIASATPTCSGNERDWKLLLLGGLGLQGGGRETGTVAEARRWSRATTTVFGEGFCMPPEIGQALPPAAAPHIRAAAAWWAVATSGASPALADLLATASDAIAGELSLSAQDEPAPRMARDEAPARAAQAPTLPDGTPSRVYLVSEYRAYSEDREADLTICILEAASYQGRALETLLGAAGPLDDPALGHTVRRLRR